MNTLIEPPSYKSVPIEAPIDREKPRKRLLAYLGLNSLSLSILLHVLFGVGAAYLVVEHFQKKHINFRATEPPSAHNDVEHKIQLSKRNNVESAPPDLKRIVTTDVSAITLPEPPEVPVTDEATPTDMAGIDGVMGTGLGNGSGTGGNGGGAGSDIPIAPPDPLVTQLSNLLFKLPTENGACPLNDDSHFIVRIPDDQVHTCDMRVRGVVELNTYIGGHFLKTYLNEGGAPPAGDTYNVYRLSIDDPPQTYNLNCGESLNAGVCVIDYFMRIQVKNGSKISLHADSIDYWESPNSNSLSVFDHMEGHPISVKQPYHGEFIQVDAISIEQDE